MGVTVKMPPMTWHRRAGRVGCGLVKIPRTCIPTHACFAHNRFALRSHTGRINRAWKRVKEQLPRRPPTISKKVHRQQWTRVHQIVSSSGGTYSASKALAVGIFVGRATWFLGKREYGVSFARSRMFRHVLMWMSVNVHVVWVCVCFACNAMQCNTTYASMCAHLCASLHMYVQLLCLFNLHMFMQYMYV